MLQPEVRDAVVAGCKAAGFIHVALDLEGYRTGSLNLSLHINDHP
jgi:PP-loop superfamily ATP-utilizing enzyme